MTPEDKKSLLMDLLASDLSARLPYGVKIKLGDYTYQVCGYNSEEFFPVRVWYFHDSDQSLKSYVNVYLKDYYPYLRPMSSMTEEEEEEYRNIDNSSYSCPMDYAHIPASERIDWFNSHHFDYRGLIEKGLAIAVTKDNNPYKE